MIVRKKIKSENVGFFYRKFIKGEMMVRIFMFLVLLVSLAFGQRYNYNGWLDTAIVVDTNVADTVLYTKAFLYSPYEQIRLLMKVRDTSEAGFSSDTMEFKYGYQMGGPTLDSAGAVDTMWDLRVVIDTFDTDSLGKLPYGWTDTMGLAHLSGSYIDTESVTGYAIQSRYFVPQWDVYIRYWIHVLANHNGQRNINVFETKRRIFQPSGRP